jgi:integrase
MSSPAKALTVTRIESAAPRTSRYELPDAAMPGFYLVVQPSGARSFALRYRAHGRPRKLTVGSYPQIDLATARKLAREALYAVAAGEDPGAEKKAKQVADVPKTIDALVALFLENYARRHTRQRTFEETQRIFRLHVLPKWKGRPLESVKRRDVTLLLDGLAAEHSVVANRTLAAIRRMFAWACDRDLMEASPCFGVKAPSVETSRDRVLSDDELRLVMSAFRALEAPFGPYLRVLVLTMQRRCEVAGMRWSEVDLKERIWALPTPLAKTKAHIVPLSAPVMAILEEMAQCRIADSDIIFSGTGRSPISGFSKTKRQVDQLIAAHNGAAIAPWRLHDLRRTGASKMPRLGVSLPTIEKVLNHSSGSFSGIVGIYQRYQYVDEKRVALDAWASFLESL